ncbi:isochorismatase [Actinophytocola xinjiangensis]|uniref:Isochorismatase n=1 Tax=Actinophytocola xinjiangensis TaxID=485602 RepID=A0A7Z1B1H0_9PSEU|nr:phosphopantetheine-binding protein [Actinophytocola xinjiangensis]OLF14231.1 isochorismatase [Actinophytocola xinjiangensis]
MSDDLREHIAEILDVPPDTIGDEDNLLDHGFDSIRMMSLVEALRAKGHAADFTQLAEQPTLAHWRRLLTVAP